MRLLDVLGKGDAPSGRKPPAGHALGVSSTRRLPPRRACAGGLQHTPAGFTLLGRAPPLVSRVSSCSQLLSFPPGLHSRAEGPPPPCPLTPPWADPGCTSSPPAPVTADFVCGPRCVSVSGRRVRVCQPQKTLLIKSPVPAAGLTCRGRHFSGCLLTSQTQQPVHTSLRSGG